MNLVEHIHQTYCKKKNMAAQTKYLSSIFLSLSTFLESTVANEHEREEAHAVFSEFVLQKTTLSSWNVSELHRFLDTSLAHQTVSTSVRDALMLFVQKYPPHQTNVFLHEYLLALKDEDCSSSTIKNYRSDINQFFGFVNETEVQKVFTKPKVELFIASQAQKGLKESSIRRKLVSIIQFALWLQAENVITSANQLQSLTDSLEKLIETAPQKNITSPKPINTFSSVPTSGVPTFATAKHTLNRHHGAQAKQDLRSRIKNNWSAMQAKLKPQERRSSLPYLNLAIMLLFAVTLGFFGYRQFIADTNTPLAYPTSPTRPNRVLQFQGRLTDTSQNPITTPTDMAFRLYDANTAGTLLWNSGTCSITPDQDGIFNADLGSLCGTEISENVFTENSNVWLEVQIESETLEPRQSIKTVPYALNSETLQGYPIDSTGAATKNTVVTMNNTGEVIFGEVSPVLRAVSGTFVIEAETLTLRTSTGSNGDIVLAPDGTGITQVQSDVDVVGNLEFSGALMPSGAAGTSGYILQSNGVGVAPTWVNSASLPGSGLWDVVDNVFFPKEAYGDVVDLAIGGTSTASADILLQSNGNAYFGGNVGIGTGSPENKLDIWTGSQHVLKITPATGTAGTVISGYRGTDNGEAQFILGVSQYAFPSNGGNAIFGSSSAHFAQSGGQAVLRRDTGNPKLRFHDAPNGYQIDLVDGDDLAFLTTTDNFSGTTERIRFDGSGNVGIGSTSPIGKLNIDSAAIGKALVILNETGNQDIIAASASGTTRFRVATDGYIYGDRFADISNSTYYVDPAAVATSALLNGNVGIGTSTATAKLYISDTADTTDFILNSTGNGNNPAAIIHGQYFGLTISTNENSATYKPLVIKNLAGGTPGAGTSIFEVQATGNVGIGTTTLASKLHIVGGNGVTARVDTTSAGQTAKFELAEAGVSKWQLSNFGSGNDVFTISGDGGLGSDDFFFINQSGNVGIGSSTPGYALDLVGEFNLTDALRVAGDAGTSGWLFTSSGGGANVWVDPATITDAGLWAETDNLFHPKTPYTSVVDLALGGDTTASATIHLRSDGQAYFANNVGIGSAAPAYPLDVAGNANIGSTSNVIITLNQRNSLERSSNSLLVGSHSSYTGIGLGNGNKLFLDNVTGNVGIGSTSPIGKLNIDGAAVGKALAILNETGNQNIFTASASGTTRFVIQNDGNVGIGTTTPGATLSVNSSGSTDILNLFDGGTEVLTVTNDGSVGIGTTTPTFFIDARRDQNANTAMRVYNGTNGTNSVAGYLFGNDDHGGGFGIFSSNFTGGLGLTHLAGRMGLYGDHPLTGTSPLGIDIISPHTTSGDIRFYAGGYDTDDEHVRITVDGNVGIGTTTPGYTLDIVGEFNLTDAIRVAGDAGTNGFLLTSSGGGANFWTDPADLTDAGYWDVTDNALHPKSPYTSVVDVLVGGNSTASATTHFFADGGAIFNEQGNDADFRIEASGVANALFVQGSDGNVGIGTNVPSQKLDVTGEIELANYLYFGNGSSEYLRWDSSDFILSDDLLAASDGGSNLGSSTVRWNSLYVKGTAGIRIGNDGNEGIISYNTSSDYLGFDPDGNGASNVVILDNGNVGIGTTAPAGSLHVHTGQALVPLGASTPGLSFVTNTDSGLAADLNFLYFHNNGNIPAGVKDDSIVLTSTSHLGWTAGTYVGNTTDVKLFRDAANTLALRNSTAAQEFRIYNTDDTADEFASFGFINNSNTFTIQTEESSGGTIRDIALLGGNVGIGTTAPVGLLHVEGAEVGKALVALNETGNQAIFVASASGTNRFIIQNDGNVGIGSTSPAARLSIGPGPSGTSAIHLATNSTNSNIRSGGYATTIDFGYGPGTGLSSGDISLIGGTVGSSRSVGVSLNYTGASFKVIQNAASATTPVAYFTGGATPVGDYLQIRSSAASTGDIFAINNAGNIGIGSDTPAYELDLVGEFNLTDAIRVAGDAGTSGYILTSTGGSANAWVDPETINVSGYWELGNNVLYPKNPYAGVVDLAIGGTSTASANILLRNDGLAYFAGNVGIGSSSPTAALDVTGSVNFNSTTITFDDTNLTAPITLTDTDTGLDSGDTGIVDAINTAYAAATGSGGGGIWTDSTPGAGSGIIYPSFTTDNFAVGGTSLVAAFSVNESANAIRMGDGAGSNVTLSMYASDGDTGLITYNTSDQWDFSGGDVDLNQNVAIGAGAGEPSTTQTLTLGTNYALNSSTYQLYSASTITSPTLTADAVSYGSYFSLVNNKTENTGSGFDSDGYASYSLVSTTGTNTFRNNFGAYNEARNSSTAGSDLGTLYGTYSVANQNAGSGTIPSAYGVYGSAQGATGASTSVITSAYGLYGQASAFNSAIGTAYGAFNIAGTNDSYSGDVTTAYGSYNQVLGDSDDGGDITTGRAGYFITSKRATANAMTTAYGIEVDANAGTTTYGAYIVADDTVPSTNYGLYLNALNASAENFGIWGDNGDWILDSDGTGVAGGTGAGGDLFLGESQDFALYHDGTNSYVSNTTGDLYIQSGTNDLVLANSGGNVGIGSTAPAQKLDVVGNLQFSGALMPNGTAGTSGYVLQSTGAGTAPTWVDASLISGNLWANTLNVYHPINQYAGVVDLVVGGTSTASANIRLSANGEAVFNEQGNDSDFRVEASGVANALFVQGSDGNVGIGTNLPSQKLDVTGEIELANYLYFGNGTSEYLRWNSSDFILSDDLLAASDGGSNLGASATRWNTLFVKGSGGLQIGDDGNTAIIGYSTGSNYLTFDANGDATAEMIIADGGNVGIGTTTTLSALQVHRTAASQLFITTNTDIGSSNDASLFFQSDNDGTPNPAGIGQFNDGSLRFTGGGSLVTPDMVVTDAGNVGIGTTAPGQLLDVEGEIELANYLYFGNGSSEYLRWDGSDFILSDDLLPASDGASSLGSSSVRWDSLYVKGSSLHIGDNGNDAIIGYDTSNNYLSFDANGDATSEMILTDAGNLGIGTTTAANFILEADGSVGPAVDNTYNLGSSSLRWANIYATDVIASGLWDADQDTGVQVEETTDEDRIRFDTAGSERMIINENGNVGIGTTTATTLLDIKGYKPGQALVKIQDTTGTLEDYVSVASSSGDLMFRMAHNGDFFAQKFVSRSNNLYFVEPSALGSSAILLGNVGIGTSTSPNAKLRVANSGSEDILNLFDGSTEVMTVLDGGNVGIGTTTPDSNFHVAGVGRDSTPNVLGLHVGEDGSGNYAMELTSNGGIPHFDFQNDTSGTDFDARIGLYGDDLLAITGANVGIGTTAPSALLNTYEDTGSATVTTSLRLDRINSAGVGTTGMGTSLDFFFENSASSVVEVANIETLWNGTSNVNMNFNTFNNGTLNTAMTIHNNGNIGIHTTTPGFDLEVGAKTTSDQALLALNGGSAIGGGEVAGLRLQKGGTTFGRWSLDASGTMQFQVENAAGAGANLDFNTGASNNTIRFWPKGTLALELNNTTAVFPSGVNVGIGTTGPTQMLHLYDAGDMRLTFENSDVDGHQWSWANDWGGNNGFSLIEEGVNGDVIFFEAGGNVGIDTVTPGEKLHVVGGTRFEPSAGEFIRTTFSSNYAYLQAGQSAADTDARLRISRMLSTSNLSELSIYADSTIFNGNILRTAHNNGFLVGGYNNIGASTVQTNPIFTIGTNYLPATTTLGNMYGIGYTNNTSSFITDSGTDGWGLYVAAAGQATIWLGAQANGDSYFNSGGNVGIGTADPNLGRLEVNGNIGFTNTAGNLLNHTAQSSYDKIRVWNNGSYSIGMASGQSYGYLNDYAMTFTMSNTANRGWLWRDASDAASDGAMSLTTDGRLTVKSTTNIDGQLFVTSDSYTQARIVKSAANQPGTLDIAGTGGTSPSYADLALQQNGGSQYWLGWSYRTAGRGLGSYYYNGSTWINPLELETDNEVRVNLANTSATTLCHTGGVIRACSSLSKFKDNQQDLSIGLETLMQLRPVEFDWNTNDKKHDLGFIAEEVEAVNPLLAEYDYNTGELASVKYRMMTSLIVKAVQQQQQLIQQNTNALQNIGSLTLTDAGTVYLNKTNYTVTVQQSASTNLVAAAQAIIGTLRAGLINTQELVVEKTASIANLSVDSLTVQGMPLADYIASVVGGQVSSNGTALISPVGTDTVIRTATVSGEIAFNNAQGETVAAITEDGDFSATGTSSLGALLVNTDATISGTLVANNVVANTSKLGTLLVDGPATFSATLSANNIIASNIDVTSSRIEQLEAKIAEVERLKVAAAEIETATVSGTLYANNIDGLDNKIYTATATQKSSLLDVITGTDSVEDIDDVIAAVDSAGFSATQSADMNLTLADLQLQSNHVALNVDALFVDRYFKVNGGAYIAGSMGIGNSVFVEKTVTAGESIKVASTLEIGDGYIEYSGNNSFEIQPSGTGSLSLMAGLLILDENGTATVNGNFTVEEDATVKGTLFADLLKSTELGNPLQVQVAGISDTNEVKKSRFEIIDELGTPVATISAEGKAEFAGGVSLQGGLSVGTEDLGLASLDNVDGANRPILNSNKTSGKATIPSGSAEITIRSNKIGPNSLIYVTPVGSTNNKVLFVKSQQDENPAENRQGEFVVGFDEALSQEVHLNWWIIN